MDNINAVPDYYNEIHKNVEAEKKCEKTKYYFNFNIEEYEMLMYLVEQQQDIFGLLKEYYENEKLKPFSNYLGQKYPETKMTSFMESLYQEASEKMKDMLFEEQGMWGKRYHPKWGMNLFAKGNSFAIQYKK